jgi:Ca2+ transporting ATPase
VGVIREGKEDKLHFDNILVGDIIKIKSGMNIPVDGIVLHASGLTCNESAMTGETDELKKDTLEGCLHKQEEKQTEFLYSKNPKKSPHDLPSPILLSGTQIATGEGYFLVIVVGVHSCLGKIKQKLNQNNAGATALQ